MSRERQRGEASCRQGRGRKRQPAASLRRRRGRAHLGRSSRLAALRGLVAELVDLSLQATDCARQQPPCRSSSHGSPARCVRGPVWATKTGRLVIQNRKDLYYVLLDRYARGDRRGGYTHTVCSAGARAARTRTATALSIPVNVQYGSVRSMPKKDLCGRQCRPRRLSLRLQRASRALAVGVRMPCRVRVDDLTSGQCSCSVLGRDGRTWQPLLRLGVVC